MRRKQILPNNNAGEIDEHDQPTEPMPYFPPPQLAPTLPAGIAPVDEPTLPVPGPYEQPFPQQYAPGVQLPAPPYSPDPARPYPYLPPAPDKRKGKKNRSDAEASPDQPVQKARPSLSMRIMRRSGPTLVGMFFVAMQLLLLARIVLKILGQPGSDLWVGTVYTLSDVCVLPVYALLQQIHLTLPFAEMYTLLAILLYGLLSRILVRGLKALLRHR